MASVPEPLPEQAAERPERPRGRPKKGSIPPEAAHAKPFPPAPRPSQKGGTIAPEKLFAYRAKLTAEFMPRLTFYVNREWPVLNFDQILTAEDRKLIDQKKKQRPYKYIGQYPDIDPENWRNEILRYHGSGTYKIYLNDIGVRGNPNLKSVNVCRAIAEIRDDEFPPVIDDMRLLDLKDPANNSFLEKLRMKGVVIPGDKPVQESDEMAVAEKLADALIEQGKTKPAAAPDTAMADMFRQMLQGAEDRFLAQRKIDEDRHARELAAFQKRSEELEKRLEEREKAVQSAPTTTQQVIEMAKAITTQPAAAPPPPDNKMADLLMTMLQNEKTARIEELKLIDARHAREMEMMTKRLDAQEKREEAAREAERLRLQQAATIPPAAAAAQASPANTMKDLMGFAEGLFKLRTKLEENIPGADTGGTGNPWADAIMELGPKVLDTANNIATAMRGTPGTGTAPPMPSTQVQPGAPGIAAAQQQVQSDEDRMIERIKAQLLQALASGITGQQFGGGIMFEYGDQVYSFISAQGESGMMAFLQKDPQYWGQIVQHGGRVSTFIGEFLDSQRANEYAVSFRQQHQARQSAPPPNGVAMPSPSAAATASRPKQPIVVDAAPPPGRKIVRQDGSIVTGSAPNGAADVPVA